MTPHRRTGERSRERGGSRQVGAAFGITPVSALVSFFS